MWLRHGHVVFKSSIFVVQKATAPKNGVEFRQGSIGTIRSSLATSYDVWRRRQFSTNQRPRNYLKLTNSHTNWHRINILSGPALRAAPAKIMMETVITSIQSFWATRPTRSHLGAIRAHLGPVGGACWVGRVEKWKNDILKYADVDYYGTIYIKQGSIEKNRIFKILAGCFFVLKFWRTLYNSKKFSLSF